MTLLLLYHSEVPRSDSSAYSSAESFVRVQAVGWPPQVHAQPATRDVRTQSAVEQVERSCDDHAYYVTTAKGRKFKPRGLFEGLGDAFEDVGDVFEGVGEDIGEAFERAGKGFSPHKAINRSVDKLLKPIKDIGVIVKNVGRLVENANATIVEVQQDIDPILEDIKPFADKLDPAIESFQELLQAVRVWAPRVGAILGVVLLAHFVSILVHIFTMLA